MRVIKFACITCNRRDNAGLADLVDVLDPSWLADACLKLCIENSVQRANYAVRSDFVGVSAALLLASIDRVSWLLIGTNALTIFDDLANEASIAVAELIDKFI